MARGVAVRIQPNVLDRLKALGKTHCRNIGETIEWLIKQYDKDSRNIYVQRIKEAYEDVSSGKGGLRFSSAEEATKFIHKNFYNEKL